MGFVGWTVDVAACVEGQGMGLGVVDCCEVDCTAVDGFEGVDAPGEESVAGGVAGDSPLVVASLYLLVLH